MATEQFIASVGVASQSPRTNVAKDAAIFVHDYQPRLAQRLICKKSATPPNCLAVSESHIFAAQAERAVVHVYGREKGSQETTVPFPERITCISFACDETVLVLGTAEGRIFLWETCTGRQITTSQSHLQAVTAMAVDFTSNFLLSASADSSVHVWSIPSLLSFAQESLSPLRTFTSHRARVAALAVGHSSSFCNIAVTASQDKTCFVWDFHTNNVLRTLLLPAVPTCLALEAGDRLMYVGYDDGTIQQVDLYASLAGSGSTRVDLSTPIQPSQSTKWTSQDDSIGPVLSISISFDGFTVLTGHQSGAVLAWEVARGGLSSTVTQVPLPGPVTNLNFLSIREFSRRRMNKPKISTVVKPKFGAFDESRGTVPANYTLNVELTPMQPSSGPSQFVRELTAPYFSASLVDESLAELASWGKANHSQAPEDAAPEAEDFMALDDSPEPARQLSLEEQNKALKAEVDALRRLQKASFDKIDRINGEKKALLLREQKRAGKSNGSREQSNGDLHNGSSDES